MATDLCSWGDQDPETISLEEKWGDMDAFLINFPFFGETIVLKYKRRFHSPFSPKMKEHK